VVISTLNILLAHLLAVQALDHLVVISTLTLNILLAHLLAVQVHLSCMLHLLEQPMHNCRHRLHCSSLLLKASICRTCRHRA